MHKTENHMDAKLEIKNILLEAIDSLVKGYKGNSLTDIFILFDDEDVELSVYDDEENCIVKGIVQSWTDMLDENDEINYAATLREVVSQINEEGLLASLEVYTPFSISLIDEDFVVLEELLLIEDDSIILLGNDFMDRIDKEFDDFLDKLLKD